MVRNHAFPVLQDGLFGLDRQAVVFVSEVYHTSLQKSAMFLGLGTSAIISVKNYSNKVE
jgi:glutamate/tyrosine decarboxylase-like PLP-dependent enzyme